MQIALGGNYKWNQAASSAHGQISGIAFILGMDSFKSPATGSMTMPLLALIVLMLICLIFGFQLKEPLLDK